MIAGRDRMQKSLSSSKPGPKPYNNGKIPKIMQKIQYGMSCYNYVQYVKLL